MSPEVIKGSKYNEKCDVFSWGIILWELFSRRMPHSNPVRADRADRAETNNNDETNRSTNCTTYSYSAMAILFSIANGSRPKLLRNCPKVFEDLIQACWTDKPDDRPSINEVVDKMEQYFSIVKDHLTPIDTSQITGD